jgi:hypothetical protein
VEIGLRVPGEREIEPTAVIIAERIAAFAKKSENRPPKQASGKNRGKWSESPGRLHQRGKIYLMNLVVNPKVFAEINSSQPSILPP